MTVRVTLNGLEFSNDALATENPVKHKLTDLEGWYATTYRTSFTERINADGDHVPGPTRRGSKTMTLKAVVYSGAFRDAAEAAWETIAGIGDLGQDLPLRYEDTDTGTVRIMTVRIEGTIDPVPFAPGKANVAIPLRAYDPKKYAEVERVSPPAAAGGIQPVGAGLRYPMHGTTSPGGTFTWAGTRYASVSREYVNGVLGRVNLLTNPSAESGTVTGWGANGDAQLAVRSEQAHSGRLSFRVVGNSGSNIGIGTAPTGLTPGATYTYSAWVFIPAAGGLLNPSMAANNGATFTAAPPITARNEWVRTSHTFTASAAGTASLYIYDGPSASGANNGRVMYVDDAQLELGAVATDYFDGDSQVALAVLDYGPQVSFSAAVAENRGRAAVYPVFYIGGGDLRNGFSITDQRTGRAIIFTGDIDASESLVLDMRTKRLISDVQNDRTDELIVNDTMEIPPGDQRTYIFTALGTSPSNTPPLLRVSVTDGWW